MEWRHTYAWDTYSGNSTLIDPLSATHYVSQLLEYKDNNTVISTYSRTFDDDHEIQITFQLTWKPDQFVMSIKELGETTNCILVHNWKEVRDDVISGTEMKSRIGLIFSSKTLKRLREELHNLHVSTSFIIRDIERIHNDKSITTH